MNFQIWGPKQRETTEFPSWIYIYIYIYNFQNKIKKYYCIGLCYSLHIHKAVNKIQSIPSGSQAFESCQL